MTKIKKESNSKTKHGVTNANIERSIPLPKEELWTNPKKVKRTRFDFKYSKNPKEKVLDEQNNRNDNAITKILKAFYLKIFYYDS